MDPNGSKILKKMVKFVYKITNIQNLPICDKRMLKSTE